METDEEVGAVAENHDETDQSEHVDLLVIGWGKGGKTLAGTAARRGQRVALVEQSDDRIGGTCINVACVPTKILVHDAEQRRDADDADAYFSAAVERRDTLTAAMRRKNFSMLDQLDSVLLVSGTASFTGEREVRVTGGSETLTLTADTVLINTGTAPTVPSIEGARVGGRIHDSETLQHVSPLPRTLVVVGGGYVGLEFASMFAHFGSLVTVLDRGERALKAEDDDVAQTATEILRGDGVTVVSRASVVSISDDDETARVTYEVAGEQLTADADAVLLALGRTPVTAELGLDHAGVRTDDNGFIVVDEHLRTSADGVFALGDVNGGPQFTYVSLDDYRIVSDQLFGDGERSTADRVAVPYTMFLTPPLARVGLTEAQARKRGHDVLVGAKQMADVAAAPRAKIEGDPRGIVKVVVDRETDFVLGAALMHVHAQEVINLVSLAMRHGITATVLRDSIYTHPSATEALNEVLAALR
ncbi:FAD-dependent oxidoreductase [Paramicrobacterium chengjingii]|uniref:FAD-dependent oxidoreductase n=1 Tax=Paramicrobacterium chengjingii TaxID=2769067 RepID=A0ABX6YLA0_9MICO|nr:FAD-dependent oxidoreductase [Microbacterium chengjingii]